MSYDPDNRTELCEPFPFYSAYSVKLDVGITFPEVSPVTDQSYRDECDINTIMARYQSTGELPVLNEMLPQYLDVTGMDFQSHMDFILEAQGLFDALPSSIRDRFGNDPAAFLDFASDQANEVELAKMGLLTEEAANRILGYTTENPSQSLETSRGDETP